MLQELKHRQLCGHHGWHWMDFILTGSIGVCDRPWCVNGCVRHYGCRGHEGVPQACLL